MDCENPLRREYWRVFLLDSGRAAMLPRPDITPEIQPACDNVDHPLHSLVERYKLCTPPADAEQLMLVDNMIPEDALRIAHFLHTQLRFRIPEDGTEITPYPISPDVVDACALHPEANSAELTESCAQRKEYMQRGYNVRFVYRGALAVELVEHLNELYGIR